MKRVLFLDIDGVLNCDRFVRYQLNHAGPGLKASDWWMPEAIKRINQITDALGAVICISSAWRGQPNLWENLKAAGLTAEIVGETPRLRRGHHDAHTARGHEIQAWMDENNVCPDQIVILDDDQDMVHLSHRYVQTSFATGITDVHVQQALGLTYRVA